MVSENFARGSNRPGHRINAEVDVSNQIALVFQSADNLPALYHFIVTETFSRLNCEAAVMYIYNASDLKKLKKVAARCESITECLEFDTLIELGTGVIGELPFKSENWINLRGEILATPHIIKRIVHQYQACLPSRKYEHLMAISLDLGNQMFGVLKVINKKASGYDREHNLLLDAQGFTHQDELQLKTLAKQAELAYHSIKRLEDINRIHEIGVTLTSGKKLNTILSEICQSAMEFFHADAITFYQYDMRQQAFIGRPIALGSLYEVHKIMEKTSKNDVVSQVLQLNRNHFASDAMNDPLISRQSARQRNRRRKFFVFREGIVSSAAILLKVSEEPLGVMFINYRNTQSFPKEDQRLMEIFASYAAIAIKNAREKEDLVRKLTFGLAEIYNIRDMVEKPYTSNWEMLIPKKLLDDILDFVNEKFGFFAEFDPVDNRLTVRYASKGYETLIGASWSAQYGLAGQAIYAQRMLNAPKVAENNFYIRLADHKFDELPQTDVDKDIQSAVAIPLIWQNQVHGVFQIESNNPGAFSEYDTKMIQLLVVHAGNAIQNLELIQEKERGRRKLQALRNLDVLIGTTFNLPAILKLIIKNAIDFTQARKGQGLISLIEEINGEEYLVPYVFAGAKKEHYKISLKGGLGITRLAVIENRTINLTDSDELWQKYYLQIIKNMRSCLVSPLRVRGKPIGVINIESPEPNAFNSGDEDLIKVLASQAVIEIQMTRLVDDIRAIGIASLKKSKQEIIELILEKAGELLGAKIGAIWLYDSKTETLNFEMFFGLAENFWEDRDCQLGKNSFIGHVLQRGKIIVEDIEKIIHQKKYIQKHFQKIYQAGLKSITAVPFLSGKEPIGVMNLYSREKPFETEKEWQRSWEKNLLEIFANQASIALQNVQRYEELQKANKKIEESVHSSVFNSMSHLIRLASHRINNSVGDIRADLKELLAKSNKFDSDLIEYLSRMYESAEDALRVPNELTTFIKELNSEKNEVDVYEVVAEIDEDMQFKNVRLNYTGLKNLPHIKANFGVMKGVLSELFKNAVKAMPNGGRIIIKGKPISDRMLELAVSDTGVGIPRKNLNKLFEYGFTEWKNAHGTGHGLAMIRAITEVDHKGRIWAESEPGKGSTFLLQLPIFTG